MSLFVKHVLLLFLISTSDYSSTWGFFAHKKINRMAVFTIPDETLFHFYKFHIDFISEHAVDPDKRRYAVDGEAEKHYIDIDYYGNEPFKVMPRKWDDAVNKFSEDTLRAYGISPWNINLMVAKLSQAFRDKNLDRILRYSADLGHYIGDVHVPLHTTLNYNGQLTNQKGIHGFWESRVPELFSEQYDYLVGKAKYIESPLNKIWDVVEHSFNAVDSVLTFEKQLSTEWSEDRKFSFEKRGMVTMKVYSKEFSEEYARRLDGMHNRRMRESILTVGSLWFTAYINAGQPDLDQLMKPISKTYKEEIENMNKKSFSGKIKGRDHGK